METVGPLVYVLILALAVITVAVVWLAILLRKTHGWNTTKGQTIWLLSSPVFLGGYLAQIWIYRLLTDENPLNNNIIVFIFGTEADYFTNNIIIRRNQKI
jgi:ABC-type polysaccharide transport system permease subunit